MATNSYFNHTTFEPEQNLFNDLMVESIQIHGIDVMYFKRDIPELDEFLREPKFSKFKDTYIIEMFPPQGGIDSRDDIAMSKFGWLIDNTLEFVVSKSRWETDITSNDISLNRPREGDLLYVGESPSLNSGNFINTIFEIKKVNIGNETKFQFGKNYVYTLVCQVYSPSHDEFETADTETNEWLNDNDHKTSINDVIKLEQDNVIVKTGNPFGEL